MEDRQPYRTEQQPQLELPSLFNTAISQLEGQVSDGKIKALYTPQEPEDIMTSSYEKLDVDVAPQIPIFDEEELNKFANGLITVGKNTKKWHGFERVNSNLPDDIFLIPSTQYEQVAGVIRVSKIPLTYTDEGLMKSIGVILLNQQPKDGELIQQLNINVYPHEKFAQEAAMRRKRSDVKWNPDLLNRYITKKQLDSAKQGLDPFEKEQRMSVLRRIFG